MDKYNATIYVNDKDVSTILNDKDGTGDIYISENELYKIGLQNLTNEPVYATIEFNGVIIINEFIGGHSDIKIGTSSLNDTSLDKQQVKISFYGIHKYVAPVQPYKTGTVPDPTYTVPPIWCGNTSEPQDINYRYNGNYTYSSGTLEPLAIYTYKIVVTSTPYNRCDVDVLFSGLTKLHYLHTSDIINIEEYNNMKKRVMSISNGDESDAFDVNVLHNELTKLNDLKYSKLISETEHNTIRENIMKTI